MSTTEIPSVFTIQKQSSSPKHFAVTSDHDGSSAISIIRQSGDSVDISANGPPSRRLATIKRDLTNTKAEVTIFEQTSETPATQFRIDYRSLGDHRASHSFSISSSNVEEKTDFEWRNDGAGWQLLRVSAPNSVLEVVATGSLNAGTLEPPRFEPRDVPGEQSIGESRGLVAAVSWIRVWDKVQTDVIKSSNPNKDAAMASCCIVL